MKIISLQDIVDPTILALINKSVEARQRAYIPYSNFRVGAALLCEDHEDFITGCNVENVSYGLTICAERTAIVKAVSEGHSTFKAIAVSAVSKNEFLVSPCGACRQFLAEFNQKLPIYLHNPETGKVAVTDLEELLPQAVLPTNLNSALNINK